MIISLSVIDDHAIIVFSTDKVRNYPTNRPLNRVQHKLCLMVKNEILTSSVDKNCNHLTIRVGGEVGRDAVLGGRQVTKAL